MHQAAYCIGETRMRSKRGGVPVFPQDQLRDSITKANKKPMLKQAPEIKAVAVRQ
jgi:hypothetical protein